MSKVKWLSIDCNVEVYFDGMGVQPLIRLVSSHDQSYQDGTPIKAGSLVLEATEHLPLNTLGEDNTVIREGTSNRGISQVLAEAGIIRMSGVSLTVDDQRYPVATVLKNTSSKTG